MSDEAIFEHVRLELKRARRKYPKPRNPKQALNPIKAEIYEAQNELEYDVPEYDQARIELIHVIVTAIRAIDSISEKVGKLESPLGFMDCPCYKSKLDQEAEELLNEVSELMEIK